MDRRRKRRFWRRHPLGKTTRAHVIIMRQWGVIRLAGRARARPGASWCDEGRGRTRGSEAPSPRGHKEKVCGRRNARSRHEREMGCERDKISRPRARTMRETWLSLRCDHCNAPRIATVVAQRRTRYLCHTSFYFFAAAAHASPRKLLGRLANGVGRGVTRNVGGTPRPGRGSARPHEERRRVLE